MFILKTVIYESKRLYFQNEQALFLKFYYWAHQKTGGFRAGTNSFVWLIYKLIG
jgi:hypothetical protein